MLTEEKKFFLCPCKRVYPCVRAEKRRANFYSCPRRRETMKNTPFSCLTIFFCLKIEKNSADCFQVDSSHCPRLEKMIRQKCLEPTLAKDKLTSERLELFCHLWVLFILHTDKHGEMVSSPNAYLKWIKIWANYFHFSTLLSEYINN